ncbi:MAG: hypothetical protein GQ533_02100 [Methanosarcinaceae archaeon]|nr:hypothetical protein [Methanosarcinaceae archaeon]
MDEEASTIAEFPGVRTKGVLFILLKSVKDGLLDNGESLAIFQQMPGVVPGLPRIRQWSLKRCYAGCEVHQLLQALNLWT